MRCSSWSCFRKRNKNGWNVETKTVAKTKQRPCATWKWRSLRFYGHRCLTTEWASYAISSICGVAERFFRIRHQMNTKFTLKFKFRGIQATPVQYECSIAACIIQNLLGSGNMSDFCNSSCGCDGSRMQQTTLDRILQPEYIRTLWKRAVERRRWI